MADASASAPTPRIGARELLTEEQLVTLRERSLWRGLWLIAHAWGVILGGVALGDASWPLAQRAAHFWGKLGPQVLVNALLFAGLAVAGVWWAYPLLWLLPLLTWFMVITRIRNIAEHAVVGEADDPLRNTRTTLASWLERAFVAPYFVNYHLEHHLFYY